MNMNAVIAVLVLKGIITIDEGEKLVEFLNNKPQGPMLADVMAQVGEFVTEEKQEVGKVAGESKSAGKKAVDAAKHVAGEVEEKIKEDVEAIDNEAKVLEQGATGTASPATNTPETAKVPNSGQK